MTLTFTCLHCGKKLPFNRRLKNKQQKYCSNKECQRARMRVWKLLQYRKSHSYRQKSKERQKIWRKKYPSDQYQKEYREKHPVYVNCNRELQRERNKKRKKETVSMIVKTDAMIFQPCDDGSYLLSKVKKNMIVNRNALSLQPSTDGAYMLFRVNERKIVNRNALLSQGLSI
jgi:hypothetical protein